MLSTEPKFGTYSGTEGTCNWYPKFLNDGGHGVGGVSVAYGYEYLMLKKNNVFV